MLSMDSVVKFKVVAAIVFGVVLALLSIFLNPEHIIIMNLSTTYLLLIVYFISLIPTVLACLVLYGYKYTIKELFTKGTLAFYCLEFLIWVIIFDVYKTVALKLFG